MLHLLNGRGYGYGRGHGNGYGHGHGDGYGRGNGDGYGHGYGYGYGHEDGESPDNYTIEDGGDLLVRLAATNQLRRIK